MNALTRSNVVVSAPLLRYLNTGTLALLMFVALAFLPATHGKDSEAAKSSPAKASVVIDQFSFSPNTITAARGATVTWTNRDKVAHLIASDGDQFQKSQLLKPGESFSRTFPVTGTYSYFCSIHPRMTGKIVIEASSR